MKKEKQTTKEERMKEYEAKRKLEMTNWEDLSIDQKIERMRGIIKNTERVSQSNAKELNELNAIFSEHQHKDNDILIKYKKYGYGMGECESAQKAENYF